MTDQYIETLIAATKIPPGAQVLGHYPFMEDGRGAKVFIGLDKKLFVRFDIALHPDEAEFDLRAAIFAKLNVVYTVAELEHRLPLTFPQEEAKARKLLNLRRQLLAHV